MNTVKLNLFSQSLAQAITISTVLDLQLKPFVIYLKNKVFWFSSCFLLVIIFELWTEFQVVVILKAFSNKVSL